MSEHRQEENEQNRAAWLALFKEIGNVLVVGLGVVAFGALVFFAGRWLDFHNYLELFFKFAVIVFCVVVSGFFLWLRKESLRAKMFGGSRGWLENTGQQPTGVQRVSVEHEDGKIQWNVSVSDVSWELSHKNPVKSYFPKLNKAE